MEAEIAEEAIPMQDLGDIVRPQSVSPDAEPTDTHRLKRRHFVLLCVMLLNFSNTAQWISYAPISNYVSSYYAGGAAAGFSLIYMAMTIPFGFIGMWLGNSRGLKRSFFLAAAVNSLGATIRLFSDTFEGYTYHYHMAMLGQAVSSLAYPFIMFLPTKVSADWFPTDQQTLATTLGVMSNPLAVLTVNLVVPFIVTKASDVMWLNVILCGLSVTAGFLILMLVTDDRPIDSNPNAAAPASKMSYRQNLRMCLTNGSYWLILLVIGGGIGMFNCLYTMMQELMCPSGYGNHEAGYCAMLMIAAGVAGAIIGGRLVDMYPRLFKWILLGAIAFAVLFGLIFLQLTRLKRIQLALALMSCLFGFTGVAVYPIGLQMAYRITQPAAAEVSSGLIVLMGQLLSLLFVSIFKAFARPLTPTEIDLSDEKCRLSAEDTVNIPKDYLTSILTVSVIASTLPILMIFVKPDGTRNEDPSQATQRRPRDVENRPEADALVHHENI